MGTRTLSGVLSDKEQIGGELLQILDHATDPWGKFKIFQFESYRMFKVSLSRELKSKMSDFPKVFNEQWQLKRKPHVKPRPRSSLLRVK